MNLLMFNSYRFFMLLIQYPYIIIALLRITKFHLSVFRRRYKWVTGLARKLPETIYLTANLMRQLMRPLDLFELFEGYVFREETAHGSTNSLRYCRIYAAEWYPRRRFRYTISTSGCSITRWCAIVARTNLRFMFPLG